jgi:hypothetical protein
MGAGIHIYPSHPPWAILRRSVTGKMCFQTRQIVQWSVVACKQIMNEIGGMNVND